MGEFPKIKSRRTIDISPWMKVIEREVAYKDGTTELYHAVGQQDYIAIVALTPDGRIPVVRQYRPALERHTWELPAGLVDAGEDPARTCERELLEETGHTSKAVHALGIYSPCTARLSNRVHSFFVEAGPRTQGDRGRHRAQSGEPFGTGRHDLLGRVHPAASHRRADAGRNARIYRSDGISSIWPRFRRRKTWSSARHPSHRAHRRNRE